MIFIITDIIILFFRTIFKKMSKKTTWPELEGKNIEEAKKVILADNSNLDLVVVPVGDFITCDYRTNRVTISVDRST